MPTGTPRNGENSSWFKVGHRHSEEMKKKIGISGFGRIPWNKNKKFSEEAKRKMSESHKGKIGNWKGGITKNKNYYRWARNKRNRLKRSNLSGSFHTFGEWEMLKKQYGFMCPCCKKKEPFIGRFKSLTEDHIIPLSKGGSDYIENIQPLCQRCNCEKHTKIIKF